MNIKILSMLMACSVMVPVEAPSFLDRCSSSLNDLYDMGAKLAKTGVIAILILAVLPADANHVSHFSGNNPLEHAGAKAVSHVSSEQLPVGNCTFYYDYLAKHPNVMHLMNSINATCPIKTALTNFDWPDANINDSVAIDLAPALYVLMPPYYDGASIDLSNNNFGIAGAKALSILQPYIGVLNLANNKLGFMGISFFLPALPPGNENHFYGFNISGVGLDANGASQLGAILQTYLSFSSLDISNNNVGPNGTLSIVSGLPDCTSFFSLANNSITDVGAKFLIDYFPSCGQTVFDSGLPVVDISGNGIHNFMCDLLRIAIRKAYQASGGEAIVLCN